MLESSSACLSLLRCNKALGGVSETRQLRAPGAQAKGPTLEVRETPVSVRDPGQSVPHGCNVWSWGGVSRARGTCEH